MTQINIEDIATMAEIAEEFGVHKTAVHNWTIRFSDFPKPVRVLGARTAIYDMAEVKDWSLIHPGIGIGGFQKGNTTNRLRKDRGGRA